MRSSQHCKPQKENTKCKVNKKKRGKKSTVNMYNNVVMENLESINEAIRIHKSERGDSKGSWRLVPKDSCEVYKERRRRQIENDRKRDEEASFSDDSYYSDRDPKTRRKIQKKVRKKQRRVKTCQRKRQNRRSSSVPSASYTVSSMSVSTSVSTTDIEEY